MGEITTFLLITILIGSIVSGVLQYDIKKEKADELNETADDGIYRPWEEDIDYSAPQSDYTHEDIAYLNSFQESQYAEIKRTSASLRSLRKIYKIAELTNWVDPKYALEMYKKLYIYFANSEHVDEITSELVDKQIAKINIIDNSLTKLFLSSEYASSHLYTERWNASTETLLDIDEESLSSVNFNKIEVNDHSKRVIEALSTYYKTSITYLNEYIVDELDGQLTDDLATLRGLIEN